MLKMSNKRYLNKVRVGIMYSRLEAGITDECALDPLETITFQKYTNDHGPITRATSQMQNQSTNVGVYSTQGGDNSNSVTPSAQTPSCAKSEPTLNEAPEGYDEYDLDLFDAAASSTPTTPQTPPKSIYQLPSARRSRGRNRRGTRQTRGKPTSDFNTKSASVTRKINATKNDINAPSVLSGIFYFLFFCCLFVFDFLHCFLYFF